MSSASGTKRSGEEVPDGAEPLEEVGPAACGATPRECEQKSGDVSLERVMDSEARVADELAEQFPIEPIPMVPHPVDGIPVPANERHGLATAAPFTIDHVVCVEDDRQYVEVFEGEIAAHEELHGELDKRLRSMLTFRQRYNSSGVEETRLVIDPSEIVKRFGLSVYVMKSGTREGWTSASDLLLLVRPIRERCRHYKRQVFSNDEEQDETKFGHRIIFRNCTMRKSVGGAFMSLRDEAVYACDYRSPAAPESIVRYLDEPDGRQLRSRAHLKMIALFGLTAEPESYQPPATVVEAPTAAVTNGEAAKGESP